jgi:nitrogen regulatory protein P-II 1
MKLVIVFLNKVEFLDDLLSGFLEIGVTGATVMDTVGMGRIISKNIPIFAGLREAFAGSSPSNKTILAVVDDGLVEQVAAVVDDLLESFHEERGAFVVSLPIDKVFGLKK